MKNETEDIVYRCKDCSKYNLCRYYHRRKETSQICHYFELQGKTGKWIKRHYVCIDKLDTFICSECRYECCYDAETGVSAEDYKYCPNCGAKMEVDDG